MSPLASQHKRVDWDLDRFTIQARRIKHWGAIGPADRLTDRLEAHFLWPPILRRPSAFFGGNRTGQEGGACLLTLPLVGQLHSAPAWILIALLSARQDKSSAPHPAVHTASCSFPLQKWIKHPEMWWVAEGCRIEGGFVAIPKMRWTTDRCLPQLLEVNFLLISQRWLDINVWEVRVGVSWGCRGLCMVARHLWGIFPLAYSSVSAHFHCHQHGSKGYHFGTCFHEFSEIPKILTIDAESESFIKIATCSCLLQKKIRERGTGTRYETMFLISQLVAAKQCQEK